MSELDTRDLLHGWEHATWYAACEHWTRGQAKAQVAWDEGELFTAFRCKRVWLVYREVTEADAEDVWLDDWYPGYKAWIGCNPGDVGAVAWWEVTLPRPLAARSPSRTEREQADAPNSQSTPSDAKSLEFSRENLRTVTQERDDWRLTVWEHLVGDLTDDGTTSAGYDLSDIPHDVLRGYVVDALSSEDATQPTGDKE